MEALGARQQSLLRAPGVARLFALSTLARTPEAAVGLLLILRVRELHGSFALAGGVSAAVGGSMAAGGPLLGRLIDRRGQTGVLVATAVVASAAAVAAALVPVGVTPAVLVLVAVLLGLCAPPVAPCLRALFGHALDRNLRDRALTMDAALQEISFTAGPLVFVTGLGAVSASAGLVAAAASLLAGTLAFALSPESRAVPSDPRRRPRWGALHSRGIRTLLVAAIGIGVMFGATEVALARVAEHHGGASTFGLLIVVWSAPSLVAGLAIVRHGGPRNVPRALVVLTAVAGALTAGLALMPNLPTTAALLPAAGAIAAPLFGALYSLVSTTAPEGCLTEANTWLGSGLFVGLAAGSGLGGTLISTSGAWAAFVAGGIGAGLAALLIAARIETLRV